MMTWWSERAPRERLLIGSAAILALFVLVVQGILVPLSSARSEAKSRYERAVASFDTVRLGIMTAPPETASPAAARSDFRVYATGLARDRGLSVSRIQSGSDGGLVIAMDDADPRLIFAWLREVRTQPGGEVRSATIVQRGEGVRATIEFAGGG